MNILFVLYCDFTANSANPLVLYARELHARGHNCAIAVPARLETVSIHAQPAFRPVLYADAIAQPQSVFPDGRPADVIHACTPREVVRQFIMPYLAKQPTPLVFYLEDNEFWISTRSMDLDDATVMRLTDREIADRLPVALAHPFYCESLIGLADAVAVIQDKLGAVVPPWVPHETVMIGIDVELFSPRPPDPALRSKYGVADNENVIVYHGGMNGFTRPSIETLCRAVGRINQKGYRCRLLRTGPFVLDFLGQLPPETASAISDLGLLPKHELPDLLALADVFVQPGKVDPFEDLRLPGKVPEFLAMGRPVVMPDVNIAHLFRDGLDVVLLHTGSAEEIAAKCISLFSDPQRASTIGRAGRLLAEKYFDVRSQACHLEDVYKTACNNFNPAIASEIWRIKHEDTPITLMLARKLRLLADLRSTKHAFEAGEMLREHARYIELMHQRRLGLEAGMAERDGQIAALYSSTSWRITWPLRIVAHQVKRARRVIAALYNSTSWRITWPLRIVAHQVKRARRVAELAVPAIQRGGGLKSTLKKAIQLYRREGLAGIKRGFRIVAGLGRNDYAEWIRRYDTLTDETRTTMRARIDAFPHRPLISVVMPTYNPKPEWLSEAIESVRMQIYPHWELCIADDASTDKVIRPILERYAREDARIKVVFREKNGHISAASNSALELVTGEWVALLDHDDLLADQALFWVANEINLSPDARLIYSDEDKIDEAGRRSDPYFKCDWNADLFYSHNLVTHLGVYHISILRYIGGFRIGLEGAQDYDLALRCVEHVNPKQIHHIPRVLYHWRMHAESTAQSSEAKPYAMLAGERALNEHYQRQGVNATAKLAGHGYRTSYALPDTLPMVTLIIPTRNGLRLLRQCVGSILTKTTYPNYEILIVDNGSDDPATLDYLQVLNSEKKVRVVRDDRPFNYSALNNAAVKLALGEVVGLLNNDTEVISPDWLSEMVSHALRPDVGAVGACLWYPSNALQHGGVILGIGGWAGHAHKGFLKGDFGYVGRMSLISEFMAVTGACLITRKRLYEKVGGLNESELQISCNDVDFCLRLREAGYRNIWTPYAELYHHESATRGLELTPEKQARFAKEVAYMKQRWGDLFLNDPAYSPNLTLDHEDFSLAWPPRIESVSHLPQNTQ